MDISLALMAGGAAVSLFGFIHSTLSPGRSRVLLAGGVAMLLLIPAFGAFAELAPPPTRLVRSSGAFATSSSAHPPEFYTVVRGDTLWKIAAQDLATREGRVTSDAISQRWKGIYDGNRTVIGDDPNLIYPGQQYDMDDQ
ncbi:hypothetical protein MNBD_ACTINO02-2899 [hydrothermal vent metagenome]|uniref:LysM domain-containing protein n=1 Tax=hydrothermal vent metagenome TaxID=652676 RepID=A0A3B0SXP5_9ZZZZ